MIPYTDLVAALRHWRARNGLPIAGGDVGPPPAAYVPTLPGPAPVQTRPAYPEYGDYGQETMDAEELGVQEIEGEEIYENQGSDFAMGFDAGAGAPPPPPDAEGELASGYHEGYAGATTDAAATDPDRFGGGGASDDFQAEAAPVKPAGIIVDPDTHDTTVPDEDAPQPSGKKKKRRR